ncbi:MAG: sugar ABC transporter permease, partial [Candidatus Latescibacterota bacterium]
EAAYIMTGGGPGGSTTTISYYIYTQAYQQLEVGYAATISMVLFALIFTATLINWRYGGKRLEAA